MNIFYVNECPATAAQNLPDKLVVKMPLESAQMLCTAHRVLDGDEVANELGLYKTAHKNHPALSKEYETRYGREHLSFTKLQDELARLPKNIKNGCKTVMPQAMPDQYKCKDTVKAYRDYVINEKHYAQWNKIPSRQPSWWVTA